MHLPSRICDTTPDYYLAWGTQHSKPITYHSRFVRRPLCFTSSDQYFHLRTSSLITCLWCLMVGKSPLAIIRQGVPETEANERGFLCPADSMAITGRGLTMTEVLTRHAYAVHLDDHRKSVARTFQQDSSPLVYSFAHGMFAFI